LNSFNQERKLFFEVSLLVGKRSLRIADKLMRNSRKKAIAKAHRGCWMIRQKRKGSETKQYFPFCFRASITKQVETEEGDGYIDKELKFPDHGTDHFVFKPLSLEIARVTKITMITRITRITSEKKYG
jgi:hypothetical protein